MRLVVAMRRPSSSLQVPVNPPTLDTLLHPPTPATPRRASAAWLVPAALVLGFGLLFLVLFRDRILPAPDAQVAAALALPAAAGAPVESDGEAASQFQASGWVEPEPLPVRVTSLVDGIVETVRVHDGDRVQKGEVLASLVRVDAELAQARVQGKRKFLEADRAAHLAAIAAAGTRVALAREQARAAATLRDEAEDAVRRLESLPAEAAAQADVVSARLRLLREKSQVLAAELQVEEARAEVARLEVETTVKDAEIANAGVEMAQADLALARTKIVSPLEGRVLSLHATPGQKKMLAGDELESSTIALVYDPARLQIRVDVPLADAARLRPGQPVRIQTSLLPDRELTGTVTRIAGAADLQRNTLQAKVSIENPPETLRPEMLCRVTFLEVAGAAGTVGPRSPGALTIWIPQAALREGSVWVCDPETKRVSKRAARGAGGRKDGYVSLAEGVRPGEWVVLPPFPAREGQRVNPIRSAP